MAVPYDITNKKRRRTLSTPVTERAIRPNSAPATDPRSSRRRSRLANQTTLTQIDFVKQTSYLDDIEVTRISDNYNAVAQRRTSRPPVPKFMKQDSTLTQMGWVDTNLSDHILDTGALEKDLLAPTKLAPDVSVQTRQVSSEKSSELQASRDMAPPASKSVGAKKRRKVSEAQPESQEHQPSQPRKRRKVETIDQSRTNPRRTAKVADFKPPLVIADSTDFADILPEQLSTDVQPKTPTKNRDRIPSSQTPESIKPSTRKKSTKRQPLAELSTNGQNSPLKPVSLPSPKKASPKRSKICTLKVPPPALLPRSDRQERDQSDIWSVVATSSNTKSSSPNPVEGPTNSFDPGATPTLADVIRSEPASVSNDTQKSLPDLDTIFRNPSSRKKVAPETEHVPLGDNIVGTKFQLYPEREAVNVLPELDQVRADEECDSELGSPLKNDTQFVKGLNERLSSPSPTLDDKEELELLPATIQKASPKRKGLLGTSRATFPIVLSPLPAPRLVKSPAALLRRHPSSSTIETLPSVSTPQLSSSPRRALERVRIVQVPLNDTAEYQKSSSSPALPSATLPSQRHVFPASIPRPSQVSTQAPSTQDFLPTTPGSISRKTTNQSLIEQIAISESSSVPKLLSQLHYHNNPMSNNPLDQYDDDSMDDVEDDLNPSTCPDTKPRYKEDLGEIRLTETQDETTQSSTQASRRRTTLRRQATTQSSPIVVGATTRSQRDAKLEIIDISSSSQINRPGLSITDDEKTPKATHIESHTGAFVESNKATTADPGLEEQNQTASNELLSSPTLSSVGSPSPPRALKRKYTPIPGFDNDTQSDFTQNGHITAAYIHRAREDGLLPLNYTPKPYQVKKRRSGRSEG